MWESILGSIGNIFGGKTFEKIGTAILGSLVSGMVTQGLNTAFGPKQPSQRDVMRDLQMQGEALRGASQPVRTPEQTQADQMAIEASRARQATFSNLSQEYNTLQKAGPEVFWNPYEQEQVEREARATAGSRFGYEPTGQTEEFVRRRMNEYMLGKTSEANKLHAQKLSDLRTQMLPYSNVERPGTTQMSPVPNVAPLTRDVRQPFTNAPFNIGAMAPDEPKKKPAGEQDDEASRYI